MRFQHPQHPGRAVRLAYCSNLHAGERPEDIREGLETFTLALKNLLGVKGTFGVGLYLPAKAAQHLASRDGEAELVEWIGFCRGEGIDPFTFNAFPYGDFQRDGLKAAVYEPTWDKPERGLYTNCVAHVAQTLQAGLPFATENSHISISTHPGAHESQVQGTSDVHACSRGLAAAILSLAMGSHEGAPPVRLSVEAEPWAIAGNSMDLAEFLIVVGARAQSLLTGQAGMGADSARSMVERHLGTCLDACHSAVEFEQIERAIGLSQSQAPIGKLQYSSALRLANPGDHPKARAALLAMDEPRFLHQVNGLGPHGMLRAPDLDALASELEGREANSVEGRERRDAWLACEEWRCHFHVPVDLAGFEGLGTTRDYADGVLRSLLRKPSNWRTQELHVEIETYTWEILPGNRESSLLEGMQREYSHVFALLAKEGWIYAG